MRSLLWDGDAPVTQEFGVNRHLYSWIKDAFGNPIQGHNGADFGLWNGTGLYAPGPGEVIGTYFDAGGYGWFVRLALDTGEQLVYGHMQVVYVVLHQRVVRGTPLGLSDNTGWSSGPHLHLGYRPPGWEAQRANGYDGYADPLPWLQALQEEDKEMATVAELEAKVAELDSTNSALADQVKALRTEMGEKDSAIGALSEENGKLRAELDALKNAPPAPVVSRRVVAGGGTVPVQYSDEQYGEVKITISDP